jgi:tetratricopeptide (TPR) repeat protein
MKPHAFVAMPFGTKPGPEGRLIDFNRIYAEYIKPALEAAGLEAFRADEETRPGDIRTDMFQELLLADLVIADLTLENPNVWYELGVRHALRARGVILICGGRVTTAFDLYTDRKLRYTLKDGALPDEHTLKEEIAALAEMVKDAMESWHGRLASPVYQLMPNLQEPEWKKLKIGNVREFWEQHDAWERRIDLSRKGGRIGDILVLADEAPVAAFRAEAWIKAGVALRKAERYEFALEQLDRGLRIQPDHLPGRREVGTCLQRLAVSGCPGYSLDRARQHYKDVLSDHPGDPETWALLGRVDKDAWVNSWRQPGKTAQQLREEAAYEDALLRAAIESYRSGYRQNQSHYYSGINALTLMHLYCDLTGDARYDPEMADMAGAVRFAAECEKDENQAFWAKVTLGDLEVLAGTPASVQSAYKEAIAKSDKDWFALDSSRAQLQLLKDLSFRPDAVDAGLAAFDRALQKLSRPEDRWQPRNVILFSGHMIDAPDRPVPRFPAAKESVAAQKISEVLNQLGAGSQDLALTQGACGGDLLFTEACLKNDVRVHWLQPYEEPEFIQNSVAGGGPGWVSRYMNAKAGLAALPRSAPEVFGAPPSKAGDGYPYELCNRWLLYTALAWGVEKVNFICLWNGGGGDGPGGTSHMYNEVKRRTGRVYWIDSRKI